MRFGQFFLFYFPFIRLLGLPIVDIHVCTGVCSTGGTLRAEGPYYTDFKKQHVNSLTTSRDQESAERGGEKGGTAQEKRGRRCSRTLDWIA